MNHDTIDTIYRRFIIVCFSLLVMLNIFDGINTYIVLQHPNGVEANPIVNKVMEETNTTTGIVLSKMFSISAVILLTFLCLRYYPSRIRKSVVIWSYCAASGFYTIVVAYSMFLILFVI